MSWIAAIITLFAKYLVGRKDKWGHAVHIIGEFVYDKHETGTMGLDYDVYVLAGLIANLAAQMKKRGPDLGDRIKCSCGQVHRYCKMVKI